MLTDAQRRVLTSDRLVGPGFQWPFQNIRVSEMREYQQLHVYEVNIRVQYSRPRRNKVSCEPCLHVLEGSHLNGVDRLVDDTILSVQIRTVEGVALVDGLHGCVSLVETVC
jgi:hypothetical protein